MSYTEVGGKREIEVVVPCGMERNGLRNKDQASNDETVG